jgi:transposase
LDTLPKAFVGVDVSKETLDVYVYPTGKSFKTDNTKKGVKYLLRKIASYDVQIVLCESSGGYEDFMLRTVAEVGYRSKKVDPRRIQGFIVSRGIRAKTDRIDAQMIATFAEREFQNIDISKLLSLTPEQVQLKELNKRKGQLIKSLVMEKIRLKHPESIFSKKSINKIIAILEQEIEHIKQEIFNLITTNEQWINKSKLLMTVPGIGQVTATELIASLPELGLIGNKEIASLVGLAPYSRESGKWVGKSFIRDGRSKPRAMLYMAVLSAIRYNAKIKKFYDRLINKGKLPKVALVACMRKLIVILNTMLKKGEVWDPAK